MGKQVCGDKYLNPMNGNEFMCLEDEDEDHDEKGTMHEAQTMKGPVNW